MSYKIKTSKSFEKDLKVYLHQPTIMGMVQDTIEKLKTGQRMSKEHPLKGRWKGFRERHLPFGKLLVWAVKGSVVTLERLGTHHQLFGL